MERKRFWSAFLAVLVLTGCGAGPGGAVSVFPEEEKPVAGAVTPAEEPEEEFQIGEMNGGVYTNEFLGIGCALDGNWVYYSDEQMAELNGLVQETITDEEVLEAMKNSDSFYDMYAAADDGLVSINVVVENLGVLYGFTLDEAGYIDMSIESVESIIPDLGLTDYTLETHTLPLAGKERQALRLAGNMSGVPFYEEIVCIKRGNYMAVVTMSSAVEDVTQNVASLFYALDA